MLFNSRFYLSGKHAILFIEDLEEMRLNPVMEKEKNDFTKGSVTKNIINLAVPMTLAQLINVLYSIVDRIYIGRMGQDAALALGGVGITFPIITIIMAFANLIGMGGAPLCSIERGKGNQKKAEEIMGNSFFLLILLGLLLTAVILIFKKPIIYAFGASEATFPYADSYITIYLLGSVFVMIGLGMNSFINSQGFARTGMLTVLIGAVLNIILDPVFIFILHLGVRGAALATVISQFVSSVWVLLFLAGRKTILKLKKENFRLKFRLVRQIVTLGLSGFTMSVTNSIVQIACNATLQVYGGDLYVTVMTILNSIREVITMPVTGITNGAQPVLGYNYGAEQYERVKAAIRFMTLACIGYTFIVWGILLLAPHFFIQQQSGDHSKRCPRLKALFLWNLHDVPAVFGPVHLYRAEQIQTGYLLFYLPEGRHCSSPDRLPANAVRSRCQRCFYRRARLQFHRRNRLLCHNAAHCLPQTERLRGTSLNARLRSPYVLFSDQFMQRCLLYTDTEQFHRLFQFFHCRVCRRNP